jgi:hypothetical protein
MKKKKILIPAINNGKKKKKKKLLKKKRKRSMSYFARFSWVEKCYIVYLRGKLLEYA